MESYLPVIWAALIGGAVAMYVILDGFDLGVGILFPFAATEHERDQMMNSVAPFWDGNETWLVLGGAGMMVAFPLAYSILLPALYLPVIIMLLAVLAVMHVVGIWPPLAFERIAVRWFSLPNFLFFWWVPAATAVVAFALWRWLETKHDILPFLATIVLFLLGYLGLLISNFP